MEDIRTDYLTRDLGEASALLCKKAKLHNLQKEGNYFWFVFPDKTPCEKISHDYWFGECLVNAKSYYEAMSTLKNRIFSGT